MFAFFSSFSLSLSRYGGGGAHYDGAWKCTQKLSVKGVSQKMMVAAVGIVVVVAKREQGHSYIHTYEWIPLYICDYQTQIFKVEIYKSWIYHVNVVDEAYSLHAHFYCVI